MSDLYQRIWNHLPTDLQQRLLADPDSELTRHDMRALEHAGIPVVQTYGMQLEPGLEKLHLSGPFRDWVAEQARQDR